MNNPTHTVEQVQDLQERIKKFRAHKIITIQQIVEILGVSRPMWYLWGNGTYKMSAPTYMVLKALTEHLEQANLDELERIRRGERVFSFGISRTY